MPTLHHVVPNAYMGMGSRSRWSFHLPQFRLNRVGGPQRPHEQWLMIGLLVIASACLVFALISRFGIAGVQQQLLDLDPTIAILAMAILPLFGFSIAVVDLVAGAKFGLGWGAVVIAGVTAFQLIASHWIARSLLRGPLERFLERHRKHLPHFPADGERSVAAMVSLVPGPPYFVRNYLLAITSIPLRVYFWVCLPLYLLRAGVTLAVGDLSHHLSAGKVMLIAAVFAIKVLACGYLLVRVRRKLGHHSPLE